MVEVHDIRVSTSVPGMAQKYLAEVRLIDKESDIVTTDMGQFYSYDKVFALASNSLGWLLRRTANRITEILCES